MSFVIKHRGFRTYCEAGFVTWPVGQIPQDYDLATPNWVFGPPHNGPRGDPFAGEWSNLLVRLPIEVDQVLGVRSVPLASASQRMKETEVFGELFSSKPSARDDFYYASNIASILVANMHTMRADPKGMNTTHYNAVGEISLTDKRYVLHYRLIDTQSLGLTVPTYSKWARIVLSTDTNPEEGWPSESLPDNEAPSGFVLTRLYNYFKLAGNSLTWDGSQPQLGHTLFSELGPFCEAVRGKTTFKDLGGAHVRFQIQELSWAETALGLVMNYTLRQEVKSNSDDRYYSIYRWKISREYTLFPFRSNFQSYPGEGSSVYLQTDGLRVYLKYTYKMLDGEFSTVSGGTQYITPMPGDPAPVTYEYVTGPDGSGPAMTGSPYSSPWFVQPMVDRMRTVIHDHGTYMNLRLGLFRSGAYLAYHDALKDHLVVLKNNYLEVLKELPEIFEIIPDFLQLVRLLKSARWDQLITGVFKLGDFLASEYLKFNFSSAPTLGVVKELNELGPKLGELLIRSLRIRNETLRGSFSFTLPDPPPGYSSSTLKISATYVAKSQDSPVWFVLAGLYGLRLAPNFKNIWENIPMSFVVDWFTNMSARFEQIDLALMTAFLDHGGLWLSYRVESIPTGDTLQQIYPEGSIHYPPGAIPTVVYFRREYVRTQPTFAESKYDFLAPKGPPAEIGSALLYSFLSPTR